MLWLFLGVVLVAVVVTAVLLRQQLFAFFDVWGNAASVLGLLVSLVGFGLTLWTIFKTRRISEEAQRRIEQTLAAARAEMRQTVEKIALQLLKDECDNAYRLVNEVVDACAEKKWERALEKLEEAKRSARRLRHYRQLEAAERAAFWTAPEDFEFTAAYIRTHKLKKHALTELSNEKRRPLVVFLAQVDLVLARLRHQVLEVPDAG